MRLHENKTLFRQSVQFTSDQMQILPIFVDNVWSELKMAYNADFKNLVYGYLPNDEEVLSTLKKIKARLTSITWTIKIETNE